MNWMLKVAIVGMCAVDARGEVLPKVEVYTYGGQHADLLLMRRAQETATRSLGRIGVEVRWKIGPLPKNQAGRLRLALTLEVGTPDGAHPGVLAYALPYQAGVTGITVFYDRVVTRRNPDASLLGHVIVHEIAHVLQGIVRHSETGVMRAEWSREDRLKMEAGLLLFSPQDIDLIHSGLRKRAEPAPR